MMDNFYPNNNDARLNDVRRLLNDMNVEELTKLMNNEEDMNNFIRKLPEIQQLDTMKESLRENNRRIASRNLSKEPLLNQEKQKIAELHAQLTKMNEEYKSIRGQQNNQNGDMSLEMIYTLLQSAASELERSTEQTAEDFFYGEKSEDEVTDFERRFIENRRRAHELKIKAEKFHELMQASQATAYLNQYNRTSGYR